MSQLYPPACNICVLNSINFHLNGIYVPKHIYSYLLVSIAEVSDITWICISSHIQLTLVFFYQICQYFPLLDTFVVFWS